MSAPRSSRDEALSFANRVISAQGVRTLGRTLAPPSSDTDPTITRRRWGVVMQINDATSTVDVRVDGSIFPDIQRVPWYRPLIGERVLINIAGPDPICMGPIGNSVMNKFAPEVHSHPASKTPPTKIVIDGTNQDGSWLTTVGENVCNYDIMHYELGAHTQIGGPGSYVNGGPPPVDGQTMKFQVRARSTPRTFGFRNDIAQGFHMPGGVSNNGYTIDRNNFLMGQCRYFKSEQRWFIEYFNMGYGISGPPPRPRIFGRWFSAGPTVSRGITTSADVPAGSQIVLFHCADYGARGDLLAPSGTAGGPWTYVGGNGADFSHHVNCWTRTVPTGGAQVVTINNAFLIASSMFVFVVTNAAPMSPGLDNVYSFGATQNASDTPTTLHTTFANVFPKRRESLFIMARGFRDPCTVSGVSNGMAGTEDGAGLPMSGTASDANGSYHTGYACNRYADSLANLQQISMTTDVATLSAWYGLFVPAIVET